MHFKTEKRLYNILKESYITVYSHLSYCSCWQFCLKLALLWLVCVSADYLAALLVFYPLEVIPGMLHIPVYTDPASGTHNNIPLTD
jgi:hypothetical protein